MDLYRITRDVEEEFALKKSRAENIADENYALACKNPAFLRLQGLESELNYEIGKLDASEGDPKKISSLKKTLSELTLEKHKFLAALGLQVEDLKPKYECKICNDTGKVLGEPCSCFLRAKNKKLIESFGLRLDEIPDFSELDDSIIKDDEQMAKFNELKNYLIKWCGGYPDVTKTRIVICGQTGVGKTTLSRCMAKRLYQKGVLVCFLTAFEMGNIILKFHTTFGENKLDELSPLISSEVLFIDDLGTEPILKNITLEYLQLVLSERERSGKPTIITTNLGAKGIADRYGERLYSRILDKKHCTFFELSGRDLRLV